MRGIFQGARYQQFLSNPEDAAACAFPQTRGHYKVKLKQTRGISLPSGDGCKARSTAHKSIQNYFGAGHPPARNTIFCIQREGTNCFYLYHCTAVAKCENHTETIRPRTADSAEPYCKPKTRGPGGGSTLNVQGLPRVKRSRSRGRCPNPGTSTIDSSGLLPTSDMHQHRATNGGVKLCARLVCRA